MLEMRKSCDDGEEEIQCERGLSSVALASRSLARVSWILANARIPDPGRGAGKTRAGALWAKHAAQSGTGPIALVGETEHDVREVMIEGVSGLLAAHARQERPVWIPSRRRVEWPNGVYAQWNPALSCP